jgi:N-formylglutamate deformylase
MPEIVSFAPGSTPILVTIPHAGCALPPGLADRMTPIGVQLPDTDWYMERLYAGAAERGIGVVRANYARYVVDLNRGPDDGILYPGRPSTGLVPCFTFAGEAIYRPGEEPGAAEIAERTEQFWKPYHEAIARELDRLRTLHGWAVLWDAHSIRSEIPRLFEGKLPDLNIGTNSGASCAPALSETVMACARGLSDYSYVLDGRFRGGYTTRHYGTPDSAIHAIQLEIAQSTYLAHEDAPWPADPDLEAKLQAGIDAFLDTLLGWRPDRA